jgi:ketosteroid isomerase-like protein
MSSENVELAHIAYDVAFVRRSVQGFEDRFTDDFMWHQRTEWPGRSVYLRDELHLLWEDLDATYSEFTLVPVDFADVGDCVVVAVHTSARLRTSDHRIEGKIWHVWRFRDGRVAEARVYSDHQEALNAAGARGQRGSAVQQPEDGSAHGS